MTQPGQDVTAIQPPIPQTPKAQQRADYASLAPADDMLGLQTLAGLVSGNNNINDHPGLALALYQGNVSPQQASAINTFVSNLHAVQMLNVARATGSPLSLSPEQRFGLSAMGVNFQDTLSQHEATLVSSLASQGMRVARDQEGNTITNPDGSPVLEPIPVQHHSSGNWFTRIGSDVLNGLGKGVNTAVGLTGEAVDKISSEFTQFAGGLESASGTAAGAPGSTLPQQAAQAVTSNAASLATQARHDSGYGDSYADQLAYLASGKAKSGFLIQHYASQWEQDGNVQKYGLTSDQAWHEATTYLDNPADYLRQIEIDPTLSNPQKAQKLAILSLPEFQTLVKHVNATTNQLGNYVAASLNVDPFKHPGEFTAISAPINLVQQFAEDPLILLGKVREGARLAQVGLRGADGAFSPEMIRNIYTADTSGLNRITNGYTAAAQSTAQKFLNYLQPIRDAKNAPGDVEAIGKSAGAMASIRAEMPAFLPLVEDLTSGSRAIHAAVPIEGEAGKFLTTAVRTPEEHPVTTLDDFGDYLASAHGLSKLITGKAAQEWTYAPGATGTRFLKALQGARAGNKAESTQLRMLLSGDQQVVSALPAGSDIRPLSDLNTAYQDALAAHAPVQAANDLVTGRLDDLLKAKTTDFQQSAQSLEEALGTARSAGVNHPTINQILFNARAVDNPSKLGVFRSRTASILGDVNVDAQNAVKPTGEALASARRAVSARISAVNDPTLRADIQRNMFKRGGADGSWDLGNLIRARSEAVGRRLTAYLPRNYVMDLNDSSTTEKVFRYGRLYLNDSDAARYAATFAAGDSSTKESVMRAMLIQVMHSAGLGASENGRAMIAKWAADFGIDPDNALGAIGHMYSPSGLAEFRDPLNGDRLAASAIHLPQARESWEFPAFQDLLKVSSNDTVSMKFFNGIFGSKLANGLMATFKMFQLMKPSTWTRNALEGWLNTYFRGEGWQALAVKHVLDERDYNAIRDIRETAKLQNWDRQKLTEQLDEARSLYARRLGQDKLAQIAPIHRMVSVYHAVTGKFAGPLEEWIKYAQDLPPQELREMAEAFGQQHRYADIDPTNQHYLENAVRSGMDMKAMRMHDAVGSPFSNVQGKIESWDKAATDGYEGAEKLSGAYSMMFGQFPEVGRAVFKGVAHQLDPEGVLNVIKSDPAAYARFQKLRFTNMVNDPQVGLRMATPGMQSEKDSAELEHVQRMIADAEYHVTGQPTMEKLKSGNEQVVPGTVHDGAVKYMIKNGEAPDANWIIANMKSSERPEWVSSPVLVPVPTEPGAEGLAKALNTTKAIGDSAYSYMVENPIQRTTTMPVYLMNYGKTRAAFEGLKPEMLTAGMSEDAANHLLKEYAMKAAWVRTETMIDDPGLMTQMDIVGRNFLAYSRAAQAMVRRWGQAIISDPSRIEKAALVFGAAEHAGLIYTDQNGELTFTYPGSGAFINAMGSLSRFIPGLGNMAMFPTASDLRGKVLLSIPGAENPFKIGFTPMVNAPVRAVTNFLGGDVKIYSDRIDRMINGPIGTGQVGSNFEPTLLKKFFTAMDHSQGNGTFMSAFMGAMQNVLAAHMDGLGPNPTASQRQTLIDRAKIQTMNQLVWRAVLGAVMPAAPSGPDETIGSNEADPAFKAMGLHSLSDEYKKILNDYGGNTGQANALWAQMHPDKLAFEVPYTTSSAKGAYLPATDQVMSWLHGNTGFVSKYKNTSAYFVPQGEGSFNSQAYNEEIALGLRIRQAPMDFLNAMILKYNGTEYYANRDDYLAKHQALVNEGDLAGAKGLDVQFKSWSKEYGNSHPLWQDRQAQFAVSGNAAKDQIRELKNMVDANDVPGTVDKAHLTGMLQSYDNYEQWKSSHPATTYGYADMRTMMAQSYRDHMLSLAKSSPQLREIYDGIFRTLDPKLDYLGAEN